MAKKNTKTCLICGKKYEYCTSCRGAQSAEYWKTNWCSENCKAISNIIGNVYANQTSVADARTQLGKCDLTKLTSFLEVPKKNINNILNGNTVKDDANKTAKAETK